MGFFYFINLKNFFFYDYNVTKNSFFRLTSFIKLFNIIFKKNFKNFNFLFFIFFKYNLFIDVNIFKFFFFLKFLKNNTVIYDVFKFFDFNQFLIFSNKYERKNNYFFKKISLNINFLKLYNLYKSIFNLSVYFYKFTNKIKIYKNINLFYYIRYLNSFFNKFITLNKKNVSEYNILFLRKNRIFNKSRYSRNRQLYRTGVYWCLWLNIIIVYMLFFYFYRLSFNFSFFWYGLFILFFSFIWSKVVKYNFFFYKNILSEFYNLYLWFGLIFKNFFNFIEVENFKKFNLFLHNFNYINIYKFKNFIFFVCFKHFFFYINRKINNIGEENFNAFWDNNLYSKIVSGIVLIKNSFIKAFNNSTNDKSLLKYKSLIFFLNEIYIGLLNPLFIWIKQLLSFPHLTHFIKDVINFYRFYRF